MDDTHLLAEAAAHMGDPSRAAMLWSLMGGESRPASELARLAIVSPQTASNHLARLERAGFVTVECIGRNRFYRLSGTDVSAALESLAALGFRNISRPGTAQTAAPRLVFARTCYDHMAGELAVAIYKRLLDKRYLEFHRPELVMTPLGESAFTALGIDVFGARRRRRRFAYGCLDWSQRIFHLGGALGAALLDWLVAERVLRVSKDTRMLRITDSGILVMKKAFGLELTHQRHLTL